MECCSEMILSGYKGGIYQAITFPRLYLALSVCSLVWLWSEYIQLVLCSLSHMRKPTFVPHVGFRREQLTPPWEVASHGAFKLDKCPDRINNQTVCVCVSACQRKREYILQKCTFKKIIVYLN